MSNNGSYSECYGLLQWYQAMGVDEGIEEISLIERLAQSRIKGLSSRESALSSSSPKSYVSASKSQHQNEYVEEHREVEPIMPVKKTLPSLIASTSDAVAQAHSLAESCLDIPALHSVIKQFEGCGLKATALNTVFADGNVEAPLMLIGEAPGADEDRQGIPFCGESGKLLDQMLATIGLARQENLYISNMIYWRPPGNRRPTAEEISICSPFVRRHIQLKKPRILLLLGATAVQGILGRSEAMSTLRGKQHVYYDAVLGEIPCFALFHPAYLLRQPSQKALMWSDLLSIKRFVAQHHLLTLS
jgi:uracil-DNA glycosylase family 4